MAGLLIGNNLVFCDRPIATTLQGIYVTSKKTKLNQFISFNNWLILFTVKNVLLFKKTFYVFAQKQNSKIELFIV